MTTYRALDMLTDKHPPTWRGMAPYWRPPVEKAFKAIQERVVMPAWSWASPTADMSGAYVSLDANAAYLSAASTVMVAHGGLVRATGNIPAGGLHPGYYLIDNHQWPDPQIPSPLGTMPHDPRIWVAQPTLGLLMQLEATGHWPAVTVHDSWLSKDLRAVRLRNWTSAIRDDRNEVIRTLEKDRGDTDAIARYDAIKTGYSVALQIMLSGTIKIGDEDKKAPIRRPDWYHAVLAQHAATLWRKTWYALMAGFPPAGIGGVDEVIYREGDFYRLRESNKTPLIIDETGMLLGSFKTKMIRTYQEQATADDLFEDAHCGHLGCAYGTCMVGEGYGDDGDEGDW